MVRILDLLKCVYIKHCNDYDYFKCDEGSKKEEEDLPA